MNNGTVAAAPAPSLRNRTAFITGASSGLGARFARVLAAAGANVVLAARRIERLKRLAEEINQGCDRHWAAAVSLDVTEESSVIAAYDYAEQTFGGVDTIVANAGAGGDGRATEISAATFDHAMAINLRGVFFTAREGAKRLIAAGSREKANGRIVLISSITAKRPSRGLAAYSASKAAVSQLGRALALEWARLGVNVNVISPG